MEIKHVAVIGAGTMGAGIASSVISAGFEVIMVDINDKILSKGKKTVEKILTKSVEKEKMSEQEKKDALKRIEYSSDINNVSSSELIIEAATENPQIKKNIL